MADHKNDSFSKIPQWVQFAIVIGSVLFSIAMTYSKIEDTSRRVAVIELHQEQMVGVMHEITVNLATVTANQKTVIQELAALKQMHMKP
jgi:flagellar basal body-associated protein FliL